MGDTSELGRSAMRDATRRRATYNHPVSLVVGVVRVSEVVCSFEMQLGGQVGLACGLLDDFTAPPFSKAAYLPGTVQPFTVRHSHNSNLSEPVCYRYGPPPKCSHGVDLAWLGQPTSVAQPPPAATYLLASEEHPIVQASGLSVAIRSPKLLPEFRHR